MQYCTRLFPTREIICFSKKSAQRSARALLDPHTHMPDSFFATKSRKRKRVTVKDTGPSSSKKVQKTSNGRPAPANAKGKGKARAAAAVPDEDLHSDGSESGALEDMDLRADEVDPNESGDEDAGETPAEKRLRLAKLYLQSVREDLGASLRPTLYRPWRSHCSFFFFGTISGWGGRCGRNRQRADIRSSQRGRPRARGKATLIRGRLCECSRSFTISARVRPLIPM